MKRWLKVGGVLSLFVLTALACAGPFARGGPTPSLPPPATEPAVVSAQPPPPVSTPTAAAPTATPGAAVEGLLATALSPISVALEWATVAEAAGYRLSAQYGAEAPVPIADLPSGRTRFVHFIAPGSPRLNYILSALNGNDVQVVASAEVTLPPFAPQPITVQPVAATAVPGLGEPPPLPTLDPLNPDPAALETLTAYAAGLGEQLSAVAPPVWSKQAIGPEGGVITVTAPNTARFMLEVPPGAVDVPTTFYLTPIDTLIDSPFANDPLAAVQIHPPIQFHTPLTLTLMPPAEVAAVELIVGVHVSSLNYELSLAPIYPVEGGYQLDVYWGDTFGLVAPTLDEVQAQAERVPSDPGEQMAQQLAVLRAFQPDPDPQVQAGLLAQLVAGLFQQLQDLPPSGAVPGPTRLAAPARATQSEAGLGLWRSIHTFDQLLSNERQTPPGDPAAIALQPLTPEQRQRAVADLAGRIKSFLDAHRGCRTRDDFYAQALIQMLRSPASSFQRQLSIEYATRFGSPQDLPQCAYQLQIVSSELILRVEDTESGLEETVQVHTQPFPLEAASRGATPALRGASGVIYDKFEDFILNCPPPLVIRAYPPASVWITNLQPLFDADDRVTDFALRGVRPDPILGTPNQGSVTTDRDDNGVCHVVRFDPSGEPPDMWGFAFPGLHNPLLNTDSWTIAGEESYVATSEVVDFLQGAITESTTMVLTVNQAGN